ncbi:tripartite motif-containing protein 35-like [Megalops cyprinoides]|uniref:tripartite motif-containing protein 35-like n=1 Tax=Megalops cyprinoides TaxID=118141 RepID=UPI001863A57E|nr:tripartite motif-containing protein 35-like [Megalops cyprinoides]
MAAIFPVSEEDLSCPVCWDIFREPVVLPCSHSFCKACVHMYWEPLDSRVCPVCRAEVPATEPVVSLSLKNLCEAAVQERDRRSAAGHDAPGLCGAHGGGFTLFCLEDCQPVCATCHTCGGHRGHECCPIDEVAVELKEKLKTALEAVHHKQTTFNKIKQSFEETLIHVQSQARFTEQQINKEFRTLRHFLMDEEEAMVATVREEARRKSQTMKEKIWKITAEIKNLEEKMITLEEEMEAEALPFLQNYDATMKRAECNVQEPKLAPGLLVDVAKHLVNLKFRVWKKMQGLVQCTPVTLDPNTADPWLTLSEDLTKLTVNDAEQALPDNPERCTSYQSVLGSKGFGAGRHSWDVEVGDSTVWALGVAQETASRKGKINLTPEGGFWTIALYNGAYTAQTMPSTPISVKRIPQTIRVQLDWDNGEVSFSDPSSHTHLYTFKHTFTERVFPYFAHGCKRCPLQIVQSKVSVVVSEHKTQL